MKKYKYTPKTKEELKALVKNESIHLGDIDTSKITDMSCLFFKSTREDFSGIETWNTSNVEDMSYMFYGCHAFNQDISGW
ncbi:BspA family leucine-rich repeat surface protein, partial [Campylobacter coli]